MNHDTLTSYTNLIVSRGTIVGELASWSVQQSPYTVPDKLEDALRNFDAALPTWDHDMHQFGHYRELEKLVDETIAKVPEILAWNERRNGNPAPFAFTSRFDTKRDPDDDFVDLGALSRNVARACWTEAVDFFEFNKRFEAEHAAGQVTTGGTA